MEASGALRYGTKVDDQDIISGGFRAEWQATPEDQILFDGRYYESQSGVSLLSPTLIPPYAEQVIGDENEIGGHFLSKWMHRYSETSNHALKLYYNLQDRVFPYADIRVDTFDINFQHQFSF